MEISKAVVAAVLVVVSWCCAAGLVGGEDFAALQKECLPSLLNLAPCFGFVSVGGGGGGGNTPNSDCCKPMQLLLDGSNRKCLCVLLKNKDRAALTINTTLALQLPSLCHRTVNPTHCIDLLNLPANSTDANFFKQLAAGNVTETAGAGDGPAGVGGGSLKSGSNGPTRGRLVGTFVLLWGWFLVLVITSIWK